MTTSLWYIIKTYLTKIRIPSTRLQKNFRRSVCCPTPKHVTAQLFRNFHYQEFYYTGRQIQSKLKKGISLRKPQTNLFVMPYQAAMKLSLTQIGRAHV